MNTKSNGIKIINNIPDQFKESFFISDEISLENVGVIKLKEEMIIKHPKLIKNIFK